MIATRIPGDLNWVLRVDGHTDRRPIRTAQFPSNWELSSARATAVVKDLIARGVPARRLVAAGFGETLDCVSMRLPIAVTVARIARPSANSSSVPKKRRRLAPFSIN